MLMLVLNLFVQDELVEYYTKHKRFPETEVKIEKRPWPDLVVATWICSLGIPALLIALYLAWVGKWLILAVIVAAVILGMLGKSIYYDMYTVYYVLGDPIPI